MIRAFLFFLGGLFLTQCSWQSLDGESVLVIAVEKLGFDKVNCESEDLSGRDLEGLKIFCEEGLRFTHAYTTSTLSQPAMTSLLTGLYPLEHHVRNNGNDFLSAKMTTVAEAAVQRGFRTSFFSGGPPILRKSGLSQGFEVFDDNFPISTTHYYRSAREVVRLFTNWLDREVGRNNFLSFLYFADLQFPETSTVSRRGEIRERSFENQLRVIGESLFELQDVLRQRNRWRQTHVVLVGLNGVTGARRWRETTPLDVYADNTRVALFFKAAQKSMELSQSWTMDKNISLVDVGFSLFELTGSPLPELVMPDLSRISFRSFSEQVEEDWNDDRLILLESGWGKWRGLSPFIRYAVRRQQYFYIHDHQPKMYNTLVDHLELNPLPTDDPLWWGPMYRNLLIFFSHHHLPVFMIRDQTAWERLLKAQKWWVYPTFSGPVSWVEPNQDSQFFRWQAARALERKDWESLRQLGEKKGESLYVYVAQRNLHQLAKIPMHHCGRLFSHQGRMDLHDLSKRKCHDEAFIKLVESLSLVRRERREAAFENYLRMARASLLDTEFGAHNYKQYLIWDVSTQLPFGLSYSELFLALPERHTLSEAVRTRLLREDRAVDL